MATTAEHQHISGTFLEQAETEFKKGDLLQASEKTWGALAHLVKSIAVERGWRNGSHADINRNARRLIDMTDDPEGNAVRLVAANGLHSNFYEAYLDEALVESAMKGTRELIAAIKTADARLPRLLR